jgi:hypothetical protein
MYIQLMLKFCIFGPIHNISSLVESRALITNFHACRGAEVIQHQIKGREQQRLLDAEKKDQETQAMLKYLERLQEEDMENLQKKRFSQKQLMEEVAQCNEVGQPGEMERDGERALV